jgi:hypothetical protein
MSDQEVSQVLGRGIGGVIRRRMILHIHLKEWPNAPARSGIVRKWTDVEMRLVGTMPDAELAQRLSIKSSRNCSTCYRPTIRLSPRAKCAGSLRRVEG